MVGETTTKPALPRLFWGPVLIVLIAGGLFAWRGLFLESVSNRFAIEVVDPTILTQAKIGEVSRIPVRISNRSDRPIRIVGNNAC